MSVVIMGFKERLKELRTKKGITQEVLASHLDIPESTVRRYESSDDSTPRRERLEKIADFFNVKIDYLLGRTDDPSPPDMKEKDDPISNTFFREWDKADEEKKKRTLDFIRFLNQQDHESDKK